MYSTTHDVLVDKYIPDWIPVRYQQNSLSDASSWLQYG